MPNMNLLQPDQSRIVESLALECHISVTEMANLYEGARAELALGARITKYLHIFAIRNVLETFDRRHLFGPVGDSERRAGLAT